MRRWTGSLVRALGLCATAAVGMANDGAEAAPRDRSADKKSIAPAIPKPRARALEAPETPELAALECAEALLIDVDPPPPGALGGTPPCAPSAMRLDRDLPLPTREDLEDHALPAQLRPVPELSGALTSDPALVARYVKYFAHTAQGRAIARRWLQRLVADASPARQALAEASLPASYVAIPAATSGLASEATWHAGAAGPWGFGATEARALGLDVEPTFDARRDLGRASVAAARRIGDLRMRYGSWSLVVAALDCGEETLDAACGTVLGARGCEGVALSQIAAGALPRATLRRVARTAAIALLFDNLALFGFDDVRSARATPTALLTVPAGTSLQLLARAAGTSVRALRAMNPAILGDHVEGEEPTYEVRVPSGGLARANAMLPRLLEADVGDAREPSAPEGSTRDVAVDEAFDWGRPDVDEHPPVRARAPSGASKAAPSKGHAPPGIVASTPAIGAAPSSAAPAPAVTSAYAYLYPYSKVRPWPSEPDVTAFRVPRSRPIAEIAAHLHVSAQDLCALNGIAPHTSPAAGTWLRVPNPVAQVDAPGRHRGDLHRGDLHRGDLHH